MNFDLGRPVTSGSYLFNRCKENNQIVKSLSTNRGKKYHTGIIVLSAFDSNEMITYKKSCVKLSAKLCDVLLLLSLLLNFYPLPAH